MKFTEFLDMRDACEIEQDAPENYTALVPDDSLPEEVFPVFKDKKSLIVPRLQSMKNYISFHYKRSLVRRLCAWVDAGGLETQPGISAQVIRESVTLCHMDFWRTNRTGLTADVVMKADVLFTINGQQARRTGKFVSVMSFDMTEGITCIGNELFLFKNRPSHEDQWQLSEHLIPVMNKKSVDENAQRLLFYRNAAGFTDQSKNSAHYLAQSMGLNVIRLRLHNYNKTHSVLFFQRGTIVVDVLDDFGNVIGDEREYVGADTIVINENAVSKHADQLDIYHECIHYEWHYMFYKLQAMHNNDLRLIRKKYKIRYNRKGEKDPLSWLEWQARQGSLCLWMPTPFMRSVIDSYPVAQPNSRPHSGWRFECIGRKISEQYGIPKYRVRARLINMGYIDAKGALNYLEDRYARAFCFSHDNENGSYSFFISPANFYRLYSSDDKFADLIGMGKFVYVEGLVCLNDPQYVRYGENGPYMTTWANEHVDKCCLRFEEIYEQDEETAYRFGRLNSDDTYNEHFFKYPGCGSLEGLTPEVKMENLQEYIDNLPRSFPKMLTQLMKDAGMTSEELIRKTGISERQVTRLRNDDREEYHIDQVIGIIIAMHLSPWISVELLNLAGIDVRRNRALRVYRAIVELHYMDSLEAIQKKVEAYGHPRLKLTDIEYDEVAV